ncbi:lipoprotein LpqH [uncultured Mycobacterium sp.]|uniref:lipoprotein LpqH n=1 Tax=uncultured Mycobacterium sp. TaxID=171292 RepID=UPI0035C94946
MSGRLLKNQFVVVPALALGIAGAVGCSAESAPKPKPGSLLPGTAQLTIDGKPAHATEAVQCSTVESTTTIETGDDDGGVTLVVSNAGPLIVQFVRIRKLSGFTGDYNLGLEGDARIAMTGSTYDISGAALGYGPTSIEPTTHPFEIRVSC